MNSAVLADETPITESLTSLTGKTWRFAAVNARTSQTIAQQHNLDPLVANLLAGRNIPLDQIGKYLAPKLRDWLPDPFLFRDMDKAVARLMTAIEKREKIALFGDYDVDGATSTAIMARFLRGMGLEPTLYIPDRVLEGYGPNSKAFQQLIDDGHTLIVTLDCGVMAFEPIALATKNNVDVVVLDHHMAQAELPSAVAIVNPNRLDETAGFRYLAAVGVTFVTLVALAQKLKQNGLTPPDLLQHLDLVALGTVCDVVPLVDLNRAIVAQGLKIMARMENPGLKALAAVADLDQAPTTYHAGFVLGPRLNAGGRLANSTLGVTLLSTGSPHDAEKISHELDEHNRDRQAMEKQSVAEAIGMVTRDEARYSHVIVLAHADWHPGVIGLIAARLKEQFQRPACIIALDKTGKGKGSARSIGGIDLGALIIKAKQENHILEGGGHAMAAGFSIAADNIDAFHNFLTAELVQKFGPALPPPEITVEAHIIPAGVNMIAAKQLTMLEPFGAGNSSPKLVLSPVRLQSMAIVKEKHLRLSLSDASNQQRLSVMMFGQVGTALHQALQALTSQQKIAILGSLKVNTWQGRAEAQFLADDIALIG